jgi:hypothetical protein
MSRLPQNARRLLCLLAAVCVSGAWLLAAPPTRTDRQRLPRPVYRVAQDLAARSGSAASEAPVPDANRKSHPIDAALEMAYSSQKHIRANLKDYTCSMMKQERIDGKLRDPEIMFMKVRLEPFSVYTYFLSPSKKKGQEAIYVEGQNNGNLIGHGVGIQALVGTVNLDPKGDLAMRDNRYPITEAGLANLVNRLIEMANKLRQHDDVTVKIVKGAKINGRPCTCIQVMLPSVRDELPFHKAEVFVDDQLNVPVRYAAYEFPDRPGDKLPLLESYTYYDLKLNVGLANIDFDRNNPAYGF